MKYTTQRNCGVSEAQDLSLFHFAMQRTDGRLLYNIWRLISQFHMGDSAFNIALLNSATRPACTEVLELQRLSRLQVGFGALRNHGLKRRYFNYWDQWIWANEDTFHDDKWNRWADEDEALGLQPTAWDRHLALDKKNGWT